MASELRKVIENLYVKYGFDDLDFYLANGKNCIGKYGFSLYANRDGSFKVCFKNTDISSQGDLDYINKKYGIQVHHGKSYLEIIWDISNCYDPDCDNKINNPNKAYYSCESLTEEEAVELAKYLYEIKRNKM